MNEQSNIPSKAQENIINSPQPPDEGCSQKSSELYITPPPKKETYTKAENAAAAIIYILSFLLCRTFPFVRYPMACFLVCTITLIFTLVYLKRKNIAKAPTITYSFLGCALLLSLSPLFTSNGVLIIISYAAFFVCIMLFMFFRHRNGTGEPQANYIFFDLTDAIIDTPFSLGEASMFGAMAYPLKKGKLKGAGKQIAYVLLGLVLTLIPTIFVIVNLSFESEFTKMLIFMFTLNGFGDIISYAVSALFAIPIAMYIFSAVWKYSSREHTDESRNNTKKKNMTEENCNTKSSP